ncbi:putative quinol monooxygenase [Novosphingobium malaysiense]|uniref:putative quinol monooxygenase n=1 Tax=Novosphingobium malaysiense TaxID=1348853 RepID=UPI00068AE55D|nr:antibiotic biosynthesis monooxygenase [Novosphingobium malaysiense]
MIIVQGSFRVDPQDRPGMLEFLAGVIEVSRQREGCLEYVVAADPIDAGRIVVSERWQSRAMLDNHLAAQKNERAQEAGSRPTDAKAMPQITDRLVNVYEVAAFSPL